MKDQEKREGHRLTVQDVAAICDAPEFVEHYRDSLLRVGLWESEKVLVENLLRPEMRILDLGCGAGRIAFGLWDLGFREVIGVDISERLIEVAQWHAEETERPVRFEVGDATGLLFEERSFDVVFFGFGGLMQIPGRERRRAALREVRRILAPTGIFIFTTHDREMEEYRDFWEKEAERPVMPGLEFGDLHEEGPHGLIFVHVPDQKEVEEDLEATGWSIRDTFLRSEIAEEPDIVEELSDPCRFWIVWKEPED